MTGPGLAGLLTVEFGSEWDIALRPCGLPVVTAYRCSGDGRHRHYMVAPSAAELVARLRVIRDREGNPTAPLSLPSRHRGSQAPGVRSPRVLLPT